MKNQLYPFNEVWPSGAVMFNGKGDRVRHIEVSIEVQAVGRQGYMYRYRVDLRPGSLLNREERRYWLIVPYPYRVDVYCVSLTRLAWFIHRGRDDRVVFRFDEPMTTWKRKSIDEALPSGVLAWLMTHRTQTQEAALLAPDDP